MKKELAELMNRKEKIEMFYSYDERTGEAIIRAEKVMVHYKCCECGATDESPLEKGSHHSVGVCNQCNILENFMMIVGVSIEV